MTASIQWAFFACQLLCIALALLLDGRAGEPFLLLSFFFLGANIGAFVYGSFHRKGDA